MMFRTLDEITGFGYWYCKTGFLFFGETPFLRIVKKLELDSIAKFHGQFRTIRSSSQQLVFLLSFGRVIASKSWKASTGFLSRISIFCHLLVFLAYI